MEPVLQVENVGKGFYGVPAVAGVGFALARGRILGLVGENGAGKSTLMNIVGGVLQPDEGRMTLAGDAYAPKNPREASAAGVAFIHQELNLFTNLSIAENLFVDRFPRVAGLPILNRAAMRRRTREALRAVGLDAPPGTRVDMLTPGERQLVEIAKAIHAEARIIIFDEPTTSLTDRETRRLFDMLRRLRDDGTSVVYISHILNDVLELADEIMIMRDGELVEIGPRSGFDARRMISLMVGRDIEHLYPSRDSRPTDAPLLEVRGLSQPGIAHDLHLTVHRGEIVGLFGLMGSGRSEFARMLFGLDPFSEGEIRIEGERLERLSPERAIDLGIAFVTEDRRGEGLMMNASITENMSLAAISGYAEGPLRLLNRDRQRRRARAMGSELQLKTAGYEQPVKTLSGGNQQKVVLGKWLMTAPRLFLLDEPTRGVDVGAKYEVYGLVHRLAADGAGVLFISSELEELTGTCDRIAVMHNGEIVERFARDDFDEERILAAAFREAA